MHLATKAKATGQREQVTRWLGATSIPGRAFIANQALEWATLDFSLSTDAYGTIFYVLTGFHGLHVIGGLVLMAAVVGIVVPATSQAPLGPAVEVTGYYWHFVDVVWIARSRSPTSSSMPSPRVTAAVIAVVLAMTGVRARSRRGAAA